MKQVADLLAYAKKQADALTEEMTWQQRSGAATGWWSANDPASLSRIVARAVGAMEFLRQYAGDDSYWTHRAIAVYESKGNNQSIESGARAVGDLLRAWVDQVEAGVVEIAGSRLWAEVGLASTDVMTQVRRLLEDRAAHPAAAIVLCGAALEIALRAVAEFHSLTLPDRPTLNTLTGLLRRNDLITAQEVKDLEQCAGLRNLAAHGEFDSLSVERAGLMEQQTNIMLRRLSDLMS